MIDQMDNVLVTPRVSFPLVYGVISLVVGVGYLVMAVMGALAEQGGAGWLEDAAIGVMLSFSGWVFVAAKRLGIQAKQGDLIAAYEAQSKRNLDGPKE